MTALVPVWTPDDFAATVAAAACEPRVDVTPDMLEDQR